MKLILLLSMACSIATSCSQPDKRRELLKATALTLQQSFDSGATLLRYNPAACDCPPFEAQAGERWIRVLLPAEPDPESGSAALLALAVRDLEEGTLATYRVALELDSPSPGFCANGTPFFEVELLED
jgi:hypothetical protein